MSFDVHTGQPGDKTENEMSQNCYIPVLGSMIAM